jgi:hypothetical protein
MRIQIDEHTSLEEHNDGWHLSFRQPGKIGWSTPLVVISNIWRQNEELRMKQVLFELYLRVEGNNVLLKRPGGDVTFSEFLEKHEKNLALVRDYEERIDRQNERIETLASELEHTRHEYRKLHFARDLQGARAIALTDEDNCAWIPLDDLRESYNNRRECLEKIAEQAATIADFRSEKARWSKKDEEVKTLYETMDLKRKVIDKKKAKIVALKNLLTLQANELQAQKIEIEQLKCVHVGYCPAQPAPKEPEPTFDEWVRRIQESPQLAVPIVHDGKNPNRRMVIWACLMGTDPHYFPGFEARQKLGLPDQFNSTNLWQVMKLAQSRTCVLQNCRQLLQKK